ncbi:MAG: carboxypeptidase regulatory-like domain-containing protein [Flavobacteriales bacterium]
MRTLVLLALCLVAAPLSAARIMIKGQVTDAASRLPLSGALVRVYKEGVKVHEEATGPNGRYHVVLEPGARYMLRFSLPGRVTKCFALDARGAAWEGDGMVKEAEVEMTLFERVEGLDLSFFDWPMGLARFNPMTGYLSWDRAYEERIMPEAARLLAEALRLRDAALSRHP